MYAAYQADGPSRTPARTTTSISNDGFIDGEADRGIDLRWRILKYWFAGTLGVLSPLYLHDSSATANWNINQIEIHDSRVAAVDAANDSNGEIAHIRQVMKISVTELARIFGVSRQAVHEWIKGGAMSPRNAQRLSDLVQVADVFLEAGIAVTPQVLRRKVGSGPSILDAVQDDGQAIESARKLVDTLARESQQRQRLSERLAGRQRPALTSDDFGTPHLREDA